jgi:mono/diheme cytochrome c family protein
MNLRHGWTRRARRAAALILCAAGLLGAVAHLAAAGAPWAEWWRARKANKAAPVVTADEEWGGHWYWLGSPEEQKRITMGEYTRYCVRCHAIDGRGNWDVPDVPDFTNHRWQACRTDAQLARIILEGRGACMPAFRGTLTLEEAWAMARYLRTFPPGSETERPDRGEAEKPMTPAEPKKP